MRQIFRYINFAACLELDGGIDISCTPLASGTQDKLLIIAKDDIKNIIRNGLNDKAVNITLKSGKKAHVFTGINNSNVARDKKGTGKYFGSYIHEVDFVAFGVDPLSIKRLEALNAGKFIAILENNNGFFRVYGLNAGLQTSKNEGDTSNKDTGGAHEGTLASENEAGYADFLMIYGTATPPAVAAYDYDLTKARFEELQQPAP